MAPEKSPAFQFYPKEFLTDGNVAAMSLQERGAYITLLCICWQEQSLPTDVGRLANIVGLPMKGFQKLWPNLSMCFIEHDGRLLHPRLDKEREKQTKYSQRQSAAANARHHKPEPCHSHATAVPEPCSPISDLRSPISKTTEHGERERAREPVTVAEPEYFDESFELFKADYPGHRRVDNYLVRQMFVDACRKVTTAVVFAKLQEQKPSSEWRRGMVPSMEKWFKDKHYEREAAPETHVSDNTSMLLNAVKGYLES